jgi:7-carboxy-7-deazaguanine synthase
MEHLMVREVFPTVQGEGSAMGTPAVFLRLSGCNLWSGLESHRGTGRGICARWCDTQFHGGDKWDPLELVDHIMPMMLSWSRRAVVVTGGEPLLQLRRPPGEALVRSLLDQGVEVHLETNGTVEADLLPDLSHVTVSPKALAAHGPEGQTLDHIRVRSGTDLKVVHPQWIPLNLAAMDSWGFLHRYLQPMDAGSATERRKGDHLESTVLMARTLGWKVSAQVHKLVGWE